MHAAAVVDALLWFTASARSPIWAKFPPDQAGGPPASSVLDDLLAQVDITSSRTVRADVVTMYSRVELLDAPAGAGGDPVLPARRGTGRRFHLGAVSRGHQPAGAAGGCGQVADTPRRRMRGRDRVHSVPARGLGRLPRSRRFSNCSARCRAGDHRARTHCPSRGATSGGRRCTGAHGPITATTRTRPP
jgi:hypothetical protein